MGSMIPIAIQYLLSNWDITLAGIGVLWELVARQTPTKRDLSIINLVKIIADAVISNKKKVRETDFPTNFK